MVCMEPPGGFQRDFQKPLEGFQQSLAGAPRRPHKVATEHLRLVAQAGPGENLGLGLRV